MCLSSVRLQRWVDGNVLKREGTTLGDKPKLTCSPVIQTFEVKREIALSIDNQKYETVVLTKAMK